MSNDLVIRNMTRPEVDELVGWAAREGWNPGLHDAELFWSTASVSCLAQIQIQFDSPVSLLAQTQIQCDSSVTFLAYQQLQSISSVDLSA